MALADTILDASTSNTATPPAPVTSNPPPAPAVAGKQSSSPAASSQPAAAKPGQTPAKPGEAPKEPPKDDTKVSAKLQTLVQREKRALEAERNAKTYEEKLAAREKALEAREARINEFEKVKATNPAKALELLGLSYNELSLAMLNDGQLTPDTQVKKLEERIHGLETAAQKKEREAAEAAQRSAQQMEQQTVEDFRREISGYVKENAKKFELIAFEGESGEKLVYDVIDAHYNRTIDETTGLGKIMSFEEAAGKVEAWLEKKYEPFFSLEKVKPRLQPARPNPKLPTNPPGQKPTTLTNTMSPGAAPAKTGILTDADRIARAIAYARGLRSAG